MQGRKLVACLVTLVFTAGCPNKESLGLSAMSVSLWYYYSGAAKQ